MYFNLNLTPNILATIIAILVGLPAFAQEDTDCQVPAPEAVFISETDASYLISWEESGAATSYRIVIIDTDAGQVTAEETVHTPSIDISPALIYDRVIIGIAGNCHDGEPGNYGYFGADSGTTIHLQDIVMQMQGEDGPRILECEEESAETVSTTFSGSVNSSFVVIPPPNSPAIYQVQGTLVELTLIDKTANSVFAQSTLLTLSDNTVYNAAFQPNVTWSGADHDFINPANQHFFSYGNPSIGIFDFLVNASVPTNHVYELQVQRLHCPNVNKITKGGEDFGREGVIGNLRPNQFESTILHKRSDIQVYPNPTSDRILLTSTGGQVQVFDSNGQQVHTAAHVQPQQTIQVDTWPTGHYFVRLVNAEGKVSVLQFEKL